MEDIIIIGSGPAGHTAAIYAGRAELRPWLFEGFMAGGVAAGGQLTTTTEIENYPGFTEGISGPQLMNRMREQSLRCGARIITETVTGLQTADGGFRVRAADKDYTAKCVIIATGATARRLELPGVDVYWQKGISACAVCDGALPLFRGKRLVVIGGGDSACEEALYLTKFASEVHMLVRRDVLRAARIMQKRVEANDKITIIWNSVLTEAAGGEVLNCVKHMNIISGEIRELEASGLFFAIGHKPNTDFLGRLLETDETGYIITKAGTTQTSVRGIFACGDVQDKRFRQAVTAAGSGCMAALEAEEYLNSLEGNA